MVEGEDAEHGLSIVLCADARYSCKTHRQESAQGSTHFLGHVDVADLGVDTSSSAF